MTESLTLGGLETKVESKRGAASTKPTAEDQAASDDWSLLEQARADARAFARLFERHRDYVFRLAWGFVGERHAEDVTQDVFLRVLARRRPWLRRAKFTTVLYQVTLNTSREFRRQQRELGSDDRVSHDLDSLAAGRDANEGLRSLELRDLQRGLANLSARQREVVVLRHLEGLSTQETARVLGCSQGTVKIHLHRGLASLRGGLARLPAADRPHRNP